MEIKPVSYSDILNAPNASELLTEYGAECSIPEIGEIHPQAAMYAQMEASGLMRTFGMFHAEQLAGFASELLFVLPHYGLKVATIESIFLARQHRSGRAGNALMSTIEDRARAEGCVTALYNARAGSSFERMLSLSKPYVRTNSVFARRLI